MLSFPDLVIAELARIRRSGFKIESGWEILAMVERAFLAMRAEAFQEEPKLDALLACLVRLAAVAQRSAEDSQLCPPPVELAIKPAGRAELAAMRHNLICKLLQIRGFSMEARNMVDSMFERLTAESRP